MNAKHLWMDDVAEFGNPIAEKDGYIISFNFYFENKKDVAACWYIHTGNILTRFRGAYFSEFHWILTPSQREAFHNDWLEIRDTQ